MIRDLTPEERRVVDTLGKAYDEAAGLEPAHPSDLQEFTSAIHAAQNIILSRPATEALRSG